MTEVGRPPVDYVIPHVKYDDKLMVGYRYWTTTGKHPLFPFGFGLSYTTFSFANLEAPATAASGSTVPVSFDVTNTGSVAGAEVAQLYVSDPSAKVSRPERELKGFEKVRLAPGETKHVTLNLDARAFSYWDEAAHKWTIDPGKFVIRVGDSSENTPLQRGFDAELTRASQATKTACRSQVAGRCALERSNSSVAFYATMFPCRSPSKSRTGLFPTSCPRGPMRRGGCWRIRQPPPTASGA